VLLLWAGRLGVEELLLPDQFLYRPVSQLVATSIKVSPCPCGPWPCMSPSAACLGGRVVLWRVVACRGVAWRGVSCRVVRAVLCSGVA
jgi:hypothetical protein